MGDNPKLEKLIIKPTLQCFCNCLFCVDRKNFYKGEMTSKKKLSLDDIKNLFDSVEHLGVKSLQISGGDPLLYPNLEYIVKIGSSKGWFTFINSVGYGITEKKAKLLLNAGLSAFNVSLDSPNAETHNKMRGTNKIFENSLNALKIFDKLRKMSNKYKGFYTNVQTIILKDTYKDLPKLVELILQYNVSSLYLMYPYNDPTLVLNKDQIKEFKEVIVKDILLVMKRYISNKVVMENAKNVLESFFETSTAKVNDYINGYYFSDENYIKKQCKQPENTMMVLFNGNVIPCCTLENQYTEIMGNILNEQVEKIRFGKKYSEFRKKKSKFCIQCPSIRNKTIGFVPSMAKQF